MTTTALPAPSLAWRTLFAIIALWTALGAVPGFLDPHDTFVRFHGHEPESALVLDLYRGAWGQTLLFAIGYALAAFDPRRHGALLLLGGIGKVMFALRHMELATGPDATFMSSAAIVGDLVFAALMLVYLVKSGVLASFVSLDHASAAPLASTGRSPAT
ncbi:MAG: hypothetical protein J0L92_08520 [Deltaproteobacteria bacterium]|nr:hypothetical protein [Deltaproteobacteria bacterium]